MVEQKRVVINIEIEVVDVRKVLSEKIRAFVDVKIAECIIARGFSVVEGPHKGLIVTPPRKAGKDGKWFDILIFTDGEVRKQIENAVLTAYENEIKA